MWSFLTLIMLLHAAARRPSVRLYGPALCQKRRPIVEILWTHDGRIVVDLYLPFHNRHNCILWDFLRLRVKFGVVTLLSWAVWIYKGVNWNSGGSTGVARGGLSHPSHPKKVLCHPSSHPKWNYELFVAGDAPKLIEWIEAVVDSHLLWISTG